MSDTTPQPVSNGYRKYVKSKIKFNTFNTFNNVSYELELQQRTKALELLAKLKKQEKRKKLKATVLDSKTVLYCNSEKKINEFINNKD